MAAQQPQRIEIPQAVKDLSLPASLQPTEGYLTIHGQDFFPMPTTNAMVHDVARLELAAEISQLPDQVKEQISGLRADVIGARVVAAAGQHAEVMNALHEINSKLDYRENLESVRTANRSRGFFREALHPLPVRPGAPHQLPPEFGNATFEKSSEIRALPVRVLNAVIRAYALYIPVGADKDFKTQAIWKHLGGGTTVIEAYS